MTRGQTWIHHLPHCPYCGYAWPKVLTVTWAVCTANETMQTVVQCPCKKAGIVLNISVKEARFVDIEGAKHLTKNESRDTL